MGWTLWDPLQLKAKHTYLQSRKPESHGKEDLHQGTFWVMEVFFLVLSDNYTDVLNCQTPSN